MDRQIVYPGAIPLETDMLNSNKYALIGLSKLAAAILGTSTLLNGLACTPDSPASLNVNVAAGEIYSLQNVDGTAYSSLAADTTHQIVKQGIRMDAGLLSCPAPGTAGQSINYLIQVTYTDTDSGATVLPYYNASNPAQAYSGPANSGTAQNTVRKGICTVAVKAGIAATTGTQTTPAPDAGYVGAWVVTVANGQTTITSGDIALYSGAPFLTERLTDKISQATGDSRYALAGTSSSVQGAFKNLQASATGTNATVTVSADELVVENASNAYQTLRSVSLSINSAASGANGLDTGTLATSTWYSLWVIWNGTTTAGLMSLSATAPTLPSGYTHKARVGWIRTDASGNKYPLSFKQIGRSVQYVVASGTNVASVPIMAAGSLGSVSTPTWSAVAVGGYVPSTASKIKISLGGGSGSTVSIAAPNNAYSGYASTTNPPPISTNGSQQMSVAEFVIESSNISYASNSGSNGYLTCLGWEDGL